MNPNVTVIQPTITAKQKQKIRVAAYCRVSSDSADQLNSFMTQMRYYENFLADSKTETLISVYADEWINVRSFSGCSKTAAEVKLIVS